MKKIIVYCLSLLFVTTIISNVSFADNRSERSSKRMDHMIEKLSEKVDLDAVQSEKLKSIVKKVFEARKNAQKSHGYLLEAIADNLKQTNFDDANIKKIFEQVEETRLHSQSVLLDALKEANESFTLEQRNEFAEMLEHFNDRHSKYMKRKKQNHDDQ